MAEITLVRNHDVSLTEEEKAIARRAMFGFVDGLGERGQKQWRRLWNRLLQLEPGEMVDIKTHQERLGWFHRKHMAMESKVFEAQERFTDFEAFRAWIKVGASFVDWYPGPKGGVIPVPKSISYAKLEQGDMERVHADIVAFLRTDHACKTMWPGVSPLLAGATLEAVLGGFGE